MKVSSSVVPKATGNSLFKLSEGVQNAARGFPQIAITFRDKRKRRAFFRLEPERLALKALHTDQRFPKDWRYHLLKNFPQTQKGTLTRIHNRCINGSRARAVYNGKHSMN